MRTSTSFLQNIFTSLPLLVLSGMSYCAETTLVNVGSDGQVDNMGGSFSLANSLSENQLIVFNSDGSNLVPNDFNAQPDVFVRDVKNGDTDIISIRSDGGQSNGNSTHGEISANGRWVLFYSSASNLDRPDNENSLGLSRGLYLHDRQEGTTLLIGADFMTSTFPRSSTIGAMSDDATVIAFAASNIELPGQAYSGANQVYLYYRLTAELVLVSQLNGEIGNGSSQTPRISSDGTRVAFSSYATNLLVEAPAGVYPTLSIYMHDTAQNSTELVSVAESESTLADFHFRPSIDDSGRWVSFASTAENLTADDINNSNDVFVRDTLLKTTKLVSTNENGVQGNDDSNFSTLTGNGTGIVFTSNASNLYVGSRPYTSANTNIYYKNLETQHTELISAQTDGTPSRVNSAAPAITDDGRYVVFSSSDSELVLPRASGSNFVYLRDRGAACADNPESLTYTLKQTTWELLSLPCLPPNGSTVESLFADDLPGTYEADWVIYTFDPTINDYRRATLDQAMLPGQGFWIIQDIAPDLILNLPDSSRGPGSSYEESDNCVSDIGCRSIPLVRFMIDDSPISWNLLGNPYSTASNVSYDDLRVVTPVGICNEGCSMDRAFANQTALNILYSYSSEQDTYVPITNSSTINAWSGMWVGALENSTLEDTRLVMPE